MGDFSIRDAADSIADLLTTYFRQFVAVLSSPALAFREAFQVPASTGTRRLRSALAYTVTSILIGFCLARFLGLPKSPESVNPETAIAVLFVWILASVILHPALKLFRAKGSLESTVVVFLFVVATLHLIFIPLLATVGRLVTKTQVTLTYDYVVFFGDWGEYGDPRKGWIADNVESYIKEDEPEKENTVLPPAPLSDSNSPPQADDVHTGQRIKLTDSKLKPPIRTEEPVIENESHVMVVGFWLVYYLTHCVYLSIGLAQAHRMKAWRLMMLATCGPPVLALTAGALFLLYLVVCR